MVEICAIASGSNGNCYYVGTDKEAVLVDAGISRKQILQRMAEKGLDPSKVKAIFISHEHADHSRGVKVLSKVLNVPAYMTKGTFDKMWNPNRPGLYGLFTPGDSMSLGSFIIHPFYKRHDAANPCSFRIEVEGKSVGVMTDIGSVCENVEAHFNQCHAVFLESNYDEEMLEKGPYPYPLKVRVKSDYGHLSNGQAFDLLKNKAGAELSHVLLSHLSGENNTLELAYDAFESLSQKYNVSLTSRTSASEVIEI